MPSRLGKGLLFPVGTPPLFSLILAQNAMFSNRSQIAWFSSWSGREKSICVQRTYISPVIVISETVCLVKYYAYAFLSSTNPHEFGQSLKAPAKSSQSPRPSNTEGIHPHIFLQAPRREQGDASDAPSRRLWRVHKQVQSPKKWLFDRQTCRVYHGFTFESRIYIHIYIIYTPCASQFSIWSYPYEWCQYLRTYWFVYILFPTKMLVLPRWAWFRNLCHSTGWSIGIPIMDDDNPQHIGYYNPQVDVWYFLDIVCNYIPSYPKSSCSNIGFDKQKGLYP